MDNVNNFCHKLYICSNCEDNKEYEESNNIPSKILNYGYVQIYNNKTPN